MKPESKQALIDLLKIEWELLQASAGSLVLSVKKCQAIGLKASYTFEELESFDSLTSKFNRTSDIFTQKVLRSVWMLLHEPFVPFIDMMNKGEKMSLVLSADQMIEIRDLRNQIAHEYLPEAIHDLFPETLALTATLLENISSCKDFLEKREWIKSS
jgi:hypothetical protein